MSIGLSSLSNSISNLFNVSNTSKNQENKSADVNEQIRNQAKNLMYNRKSLANYLGTTDRVSFTSNIANQLIENQNTDLSELQSAISSMRNTNGMSSIEKYKYMMEQAQNTPKIDTTEPDAEKLLSVSEKVIQQTLAQGISESDYINLNRALTAKHIALSRLDMLG